MDHKGWHYEAEQQHGEFIVKALILQEAKSVETPGRDEKSWQEEEDRDRLNSQDAVKEICGGDEQPYLRRPPSTAEAWALPRPAPSMRLEMQAPGRPWRASWLHRFRKGWLQEDSQEHERWGLS